MGPSTHCCSPKRQGRTWGPTATRPNGFNPFVAVVANLAQDHFMRMAASTGGLASVIPQAIGPALVRAVQLGYTEGFLAAKDD